MGWHKFHSKGICSILAPEGSKNKVSVLFDYHYSLELPGSTCRMYRPTAVQAMDHKWIGMHMDVDQSKANNPSLLRNTDRGTTFQKFLAMQKLKKAALVAIASNLTQAEVGSLGDIFCRIDQTGDGVMTLTELDDAISRGM
jgi:hypothetical protein